MLKLIAIAGAAIALSAAVVNKADAVAYIFTEAPRYDAKAWMGGRDRFPAGAALKLAGGRAVVPNFYASADASVLFDATHILFSGKKNLTARWQIWETASAEVQCDVVDLYGKEFCEFPGRPPASAFLADGSEIKVCHGVKLKR